METKMNVLELTIEKLESRMNEPDCSKTIQQAIDFAISTMKLSIPAYYAEIELARLQGRNEQLRELIEDNEFKIKHLNNNNL